MHINAVKSYSGQIKVEHTELKEVILDLAMIEHMKQNKVI